MSSLRCIVRWPFRAVAARRRARWEEHHRQFHERQVAIAEAMEAGKPLDEFYDKPFRSSFASPPPERKEPEECEASESRIKPWMRTVLRVLGKAWQIASCLFLFLAFSLGLSNVLDHYTLLVARLLGFEKSTWGLITFAAAVVVLLVIVIVLRTAGKALDQLIAPIHEAVADWCDRRRGLPVAATSKGAVETEDAA